MLRVRTLAQFLRSAKPLKLALGCKTRFEIVRLKAAHLICFSHTSNLNFGTLLLIFRLGAAEGSPIENSVREAIKTAKTECFLALHEARGQI